MQKQEFESFSYTTKSKTSKSDEIKPIMIRLDCKKFENGEWVSNKKLDSNDSTNLDEEEAIFDSKYKGLVITLPNG